MVPVPCGLPSPLLVVKEIELNKIATLVKAQLQSTMRTTEENNLVRRGHITEDSALAWGLRKTSPGKCGAKKEAALTVGKGATSIADDRSSMCKCPVEDGNLCSCRGCRKACGAGEPRMACTRFRSDKACQLG